MKTPQRNTSYTVWIAACLLLGLVVWLVGTKQLANQPKTTTAAVVWETLAPLTPLGLPTTIQRTTTSDLRATNTSMNTTTLSAPQNPTAPITLTTPLDFANIIPVPVAIQLASGVFTLLPTAQIVIETEQPELRALAELLADGLRPATGYALPVIAGTAQSGDIFLAVAQADPILGAEGYQLHSTATGITLRANQLAGLFYAGQTLRQLFPAAIEASSPQTGLWQIATGDIIDYPRFAWRGAMLDVARHFFSVAEVKRYIDLLAAYKINRLHLHLTDNQGWRIEIKSWPQLTQIGAATEVGGGPGGYYTQAEYAELVAYAQARFITVVPEIDLPAHSNAALLAYAELNCSGQTAQPDIGIPVLPRTVCVDNPFTYQWVADVIGEVAALTPGHYFHIGGDEVEVLSKAEYSAFIARVQAIVQANGKQLIGWEEIVQSELSADSIVQHWRFPEFAQQAAAQNQSIIMSPAERTYLDMKYQPETEFGFYWAGYTEVLDAYQWDPGNYLSGVHEPNILGVEAPIWTETLTTFDQLTFMALPRLLGHTEIGWSPQARRDWENYRQRLAAHGQRLAQRSMNFYRSAQVPWR